MKNPVWAKAKNTILFCGLIFVFAQIFSAGLHAQKRRVPARTAKKKPAPKNAAVNPNLPKVTQIDTIALKNLLKREGENAKPLLINFWATWCDPCREEFPDLVKLDADYKGKIDFITISLDYLSEINGDVPKFLAEMKAEMPAYLLKTDNEEAAIAMVSKTWQGGLPFTILFDAGGKEIYQRQGKIKPETMRAEIDKLIVPAQANKDQPKTETKIGETRDFNRKPLEDFGNRYGEAILKNETNLNAPFSVEVNAKLDENGRLTQPVVTARTGNEKMTEFAADVILAFGDSQMLRNLYDLGARNVRIMMKQNQDNFQAIIQSETESENRAKIAVSGLSFMLKVQQPKEGSDEAIIMKNTQVIAEGKTLIIIFSIPVDVKNQMLERHLQKLQEKPENQ